MISTRSACGRRHRHGLRTMTLGAWFVTGASTPSWPEETVRFACIGDYGTYTWAALSVTDLVGAWNPDFIVTTGDNSYDNVHIDDNIGMFYSNYIGSYRGSWGNGSSTNRFFPTLGDHDWIDGGGIDAYLAYFTLPGAGIPSSNTSGNERYYDFVRGPVHFFMIDSPDYEPDGTASASIQARWLRDQLRASRSPWKIVLLHDAPYSSGRYGSRVAMQWPFQDWGASAVIGGHDHIYERIVKDGFPYFVNGLGGRVIYPMGSLPLPWTAKRYNAAHGAMVVEAGSRALEFRFYSIVGGNDGTLVDTYVMEAPPPPPPDTTLVPVTADWKYLDTGSDPGTAWRQSGFDDSAWASGPAELGYGDGGEATVVRCGPGAPTCGSSNRVTTWFRHRFTVPDPSRYIGLVLRVQRDDGAIVHLNGAEAFRTNMPNGPVSSTTLALATVSGSNENELVTAGLPVSFLRPGLNLIAVEVHQVDSSSSDISFALELRGTRTSPTSDTAPGSTAAGLVLEPCYPNPARPTTWIRYELPRRGRATLRLFDVTGRLVETVVDGALAAGPHAAFLDAGKLPAGVYLYRLDTPGLTATRKLVVVR